MYILAVLFFIVAAVILVFRAFDAKKQSQLSGAERKKIGEVVRLASETKAELADLGDENLISERGAYVGMPTCDEPLISPLGQKPCLYYKMEVSYKAIETYQERDSNGNMQTRTRHVNRTLQSDEASTRFTLTDDTGSVLVDPRDGVFEGATQSYNKAEPYSSLQQGGAALVIGGLALSLGSNAFGGVIPQTLVSKESIIAFDRKLTVVGSIQDKMGELVLEGKPKDKIRLSTYSLEEQLQKIKHSMRIKLIVASVCGGIGVLFMILGLLR
ncbi:MAG: GIDE domain-containing protein [Bradymonadales bacterium]|jgi:hypothetical protein